MDKIYKKVEVVGISDRSFSHAAESAVQRAATTIDNITWFEVTELRGAVQDGRITQYQTTMKLGFRVGHEDG